MANETERTVDVSLYETVRVICVDVKSLDLFDDKREQIVDALFNEIDGAFDICTYNEIFVSVKDNPKSTSELCEKITKLVNEVLNS